MRYQTHIKTIQGEYFKKFFALKALHPHLKGKKLYEMTEAEYDFDMYKSYDCFRTSLCKYQKKQRECQKTN